MEREALKGRASRYSKNPKGATVEDWGLLSERSQVKEYTFSGTEFLAMIPDEWLSVAVQK